MSPSPSSPIYTSLASPASSYCSKIVKIDGDIILSTYFPNPPCLSEVPHAKAIISITNKVRDIFKLQYNRFFESPRNIIQCYITEKFKDFIAAFCKGLYLGLHDLAF